MLTLAVDPNLDIVIRAQCQHMHTPRPGVEKEASASKLYKCSWIRFQIVGAFEFNGGPSGTRFLVPQHDQHVHEN